MIVTIDEYWLTFTIGTAIPIVVALVTSRLATGAVKAIALLFLSALNGWLTSLLATNGTFQLKAAVIGFFVSFVTAVASHYGLLNTNALGITGRDGVIQKNIQGGIG